MTKPKRRNYKNEFKEEAVKLVTEQGYSVAEAARNLGVNANLFGRWKKECLENQSSHFFLSDRATAPLKSLHHREYFDLLYFSSVIPRCFPP